MICLEEVTNMSGIYLITNIVNKKVYIGSTIKLRKRMREHRSYLNNNKHHSYHLQRSWNKYGEDKFTFSILELVSDKDKLIEREQYWIDKYKSYDEEKGYNISPTAGRPLGNKLSDDQRKSEWFLQRIKPVLQFDLKGNLIREWISAAEISREFNIKPYLIYSSIQRKFKFNNLYYLIYKDEFTDDLLETILKGREKKSKKGIPILANNKKVYQFSKEGVFLRMWDSISIACESLNISNRNISSVCKGKRKSAGGFIWSYAD